MDASFANVHGNSSSILSYGVTHYICSYLAVNMITLMKRTISTTVFIIFNLILIWVNYQVTSLSNLFVIFFRLELSDESA